MERPALPDRLDALAPLAEPIRRALYLHVAHSPEPVGRDAAAAALAIGRALAAFHLDRLVDAGLLATEYRRLTGRVGPGAGRPAKLYRRSYVQLDVTLPERREDLLAGLFATALEGEGRMAALDEAAGDMGREVGRRAHREAGAEASVGERLTAVADALGPLGFEAVADGDTVTLHNCPFDRVAHDHRDLVCSTNTALMEGVVEGLGGSGIRARFDPNVGQRCCVLLERVPEETIREGQTPDVRDVAGPT
jgi:predicted ArsR family transcriptional regulator